MPFLPIKYRYARTYYANHILLIIKYLQKGKNGKKQAFCKKCGFLPVLGAFNACFFEWMQIATRSFWTKTALTHMHKAGTVWIS